MANEYQRDQGPTYGARVGAILHEKGWRQKDLAEALLLSPQYLNDVVHGRRLPRAEVAERIAEITGVRLETPREVVLREALERLTRVGGEFSMNMAGPWWDELCGALSEAKAALRR